MWRRYSAVDLSHSECAYRHITDIGILKKALQKTPTKMLGKAVTLVQNNTNSYAPGVVLAAFNLRATINKTALKHFMLAV